MTGTKKEILATLELLIERYPEMRFGQLVANAAYWANGPMKSAVWDVEDEKLLEAARRNLRKDSGSENAAR